MGCEMEKERKARAKAAARVASLIRLKVFVSETSADQRVENMALLASLRGQLKYQ